jgi:hypothetical protein
MQTAFETLALVIMATRLAEFFFFFEKWPACIRGLSRSLALDAAIDA